MRSLRLILFLGIAPLGAILFAPKPLAARPFTVLSYNVENWLSSDVPAADAGRARPTKTEEEKTAVAKIVASHRPAVVGVVEIGGKEELEDLRARLKAAGLDYPFSEWHEGLDPDRHVAVLSRFPIVARNSQDRVAFDLAGAPQGIQRGILDVTIEPRPGFPLRLIGLHLKSRRSEPGTDEQALRAKEAWFVRAYVAAILSKDPSTRVLLFGDLNDTKEQFAIRQILGPRGAPDSLTDIPLEDARGERWTHFYRAADEYTRIDYFLASPALLPEIDRKKPGIDNSRDWNVASDHRAIYLTIRPPAK